MTLTMAGKNATSDLASAIQGLPDVLQQSISTGSLYDELYDPYCYLLNSVLDVNNDLLNETAEVAQGIANSFDTLVNDGVEATPYLASVFGDSAIPAWLSDIVVAPSYGPPAELAGFAGVSQDIVTAANSGAGHRPQRRRPVPPRARRGCRNSAQCSGT